MPTERDLTAIAFVKRWGAVCTSTLYELFYSNKRIAQKRLKVLVDSGLLKRERHPDNGEYIFYIDEIPDTDIKKIYGYFRQSLILLDFYKRLHKKVEVMEFENSNQYNSYLAADGIMSFIYKENKYVCLLNVKSNPTTPLIKGSIDLHRRLSFKDQDPIEPYIRLLGYGIDAFPDSNVIVVALTEQDIWIFKRDRSNLKYEYVEMNNIEGFLSLI